MWRIATSDCPPFNVDVARILSEWTLDMLWQAHEIKDVFEKAARSA